MALVPEFFPDIQGFQWDEGNSSKNWQRHHVSQTEAEQVFLNRPVVILRAGSETEERHFAFGRTNADRHLAVVFTVRSSQMRVNSARPMSRQERKAYERATTA